MATRVAKLHSPHASAPQCFPAASSSTAAATAPTMPLPKTPSCAYLAAYLATLGFLHCTGYLPSSHPLPDRKRPVLLHEAVLPELLLVLALSVPASQAVAAAIFLPLILEVQYHLLGCSTANVGVANALGLCLAFQFLQTLRFLVFSNPRTDCRRYPTPLDSYPRPASTTEVSESKSGAVEKGEPYPDTLWARLGWVFELTTSLRGTSWNWHVYKDGPLKLTRKEWLLSRVRRLCVLLLFLDAALFTVHRFDAGYYLGDPAADPRAAGIFYPYVRLTISTWLMIASLESSYVAMSIFFVAPATVLPSRWVDAGIAARWYSPDAWPPLFGSSRFFVGVRRFWGQYWHQNFRRVLCAPLPHVLRQVPAHWRHTRKALTYLVPFSVSAVLHYINGHVLSGAGAGSAQSFLLQPFGIGIELVVTAAWTKLASAFGLHHISPALERTIVYPWMLVWFRYTSIGFFDDYRNGGLWTVEFVPWSFSEWLLGDGGLWRWGAVDIDAGWWHWAGEDGLGAWAVVL